MIDVVLLDLRRGKRGVERGTWHVVVMSLLVFASGASFLRFYAYV